MSSSRGGANAPGRRNGLGFKLALGLGTAMCLAAPTAALAQATDVLDDEIIVTATKRGDAIAQDIPIAITAFNDAQLQALNFQDLQSLSYTIPNVQMEDIGTAPGVANFSIRGIGIASSIPSIDPTVGVFVDGVYLGINSGVVVDNFDLAGVEVLRGPQGTLYGRNVTGGAVLIRTKGPTDELEVSARAGVETGTRMYQDAAISGPIFGSTLTGRVAGYHSDDDGWFHNDFNGQEQGANELTILRGSLQWRPSDSFDILVRGEMQDGDGDGPAGQNHALFARDSFNFAIDNPGFATSEIRSLTGEMNWDVGFGDGTITSIIGWRENTGLSGSDIDATSGHGFHARAVNLQEQVSGELRYAGTFGSLDVTTGLYYFDQSLLYIEERSLAGGAVLRVGGGDGDFDSMGAFVSTDWHLNDALTFNAGIRYSEENKEARISRIRSATDPLDGANVVPGEGIRGGSIATRTLVYSDSPFDLSWNDVSPRVGVQYEPSDNTNLYAFWAKGFRSGGVNFRVTTFGNALISGAPTAFDAEEQSSFEIGLKQDLFDGVARLNLAWFHNTIDDMQRETNVADPVAGVQQVIVNAGDAILQGFDAELRLRPASYLTFTAQVGYVDASYDSINADLSGDGLVNGTDLALKIPRVAPWTYGFSVIHDLDVFDWATLSSRVSFNHRDSSFYTDNNRGTLEDADILDANFTLTPNEGPWQFAIYGNNLTNEVTYGNDTQLPDAALFGGDGAGPRPPPTFSPLNRGQVLGAELRFRF
ncbi:outer membrane receptor proteins, mostly Fe transport [alpha proteobacterium U9-1i]|nr:outer membrane receptor proteins, mostly Fe transport [alpha proteobacterium U9-1i]